MNKLLLTALLLPLFTGCKKPPESYCTVNPDDCVDVRNVKDYFYFKLGSYWVYEEENTGLRDSVYVTESSSDETSVIFETWLHSTYDGYNYTFWTTGVGPSVKNNIARKSEKSTSVTRAKSKPGDYVAEDACFLFYPTPGFWSYNYGGVATTKDTIIVNNVYEEYNIDGDLFYEVVCMRERYTAIENLQPTKHYYSPNVGLIKKELLDSNQIWNLVDYHIEN